MNPVTFLKTAIVVLAALRELVGLIEDVRKARGHRRKLEAAKEARDEIAARRKEVQEGKVS